MNVTAILLIILLVGALTDAAAEPITMTNTGTGSGTIGGRAFSNAPFIITGTSDTNNRQTVPDPGAGAGFFIDNISAAITIADLGTFDFTIPTRFRVVRPSGVFGGTIVFARADPSTPFAIYVGPTDPQLSAWDMLSSIGPVSGDVDIRFIDWNVPTSGGVVVFNSATNPISFTTAQFQAVVGTTEPDTVALFGSVLFALAAYAHRRRLA